MKAICQMLAITLMTASVMAQSIYDEEETTTKPVEKPVEKPVATPAGKGKKKQRLKFRKRRVAKAPDNYTPEEISRQSFVWAPATTTLPLATTPAELRDMKPVTANKPQVVEPVNESANGKFRLPEIPLTQVLIVAGFVILFLIYRLRVGRELKRKKY